MNKLMLGMTAVTVSLLMGCATVQVNETGFYWGNYSASLYKYKKNPSAETLRLHKLELEKIVQKCDGQTTCKVPPGIYAELGKLYLDEGDSQTAISFFNSERTHFPESAQLMETLVEKASSSHS